MYNQCLSEMTRKKHLNTVDDPCSVAMDFDNLTRAYLIECGKSLNIRIIDI